MKRGDGIYKQESGTYRTSIRDPQGKQVWGTFKTKTEAKAWKESASVKIRAGEYQDPAAGRVTLAELYEELHAARDYAKATVALHRECWKHVGPDLGHRPIATIDAAAVDRTLEKIKAPVMREKSRLLLSALFGHAAATRGRVANPAKRKRVPSTRASRKGSEGAKDTKRYLKPDELAQLLAEIPERYRALVHVMARVGLRPGEAYALRVGKFDSLKRTLLIDTAAAGDTKTGEARTVVLPAVVAEELQAHVERFSEWKPDALIFPGERGAMLDGSNFRRRVFGPAADRAQVNHGLRVNDLRHSAVSFAVAHGANVYAIQKMVGHSKPSITLDVYGELWDTSQEQLAAQLDEAIRAEDGSVSGKVVSLSR